MVIGGFSSFKLVGIQESDSNKNNQFVVRGNRNHRLAFDGHCQTCFEEEKKDSVLFL